MKAERDSEEHLAALLDRAENSAHRLSFDELRELAHLYRVSSARLAALRTRNQDTEAIRYLNSLCTRAFTFLQIPTSTRRSTMRFFLRELPATLAATAAVQLLVVSLLIAGAITGAALVSADPSRVYAVVPSGMYSADRLEPLVNSYAERDRFLSQKMPFGIKAIFSAGLFAHNTKVGLLAFATGIVAGAPTVVLIVYQGMVLGAFSWIFCRDNLALKFWAWLLPHAIPELLAVILCATAGLVIAKAVVAPGRNGIAAALRAAVRPAVQLVLASVPLFLLAALIESFIRQSAISSAARFSIAAIVSSALVGYVCYVRRLTRRTIPADVSWLITAAHHGASIDTDLERGKRFVRDRDRVSVRPSGRSV